MKIKINGTVMECIIWTHIKSLIINGLHAWMDAILIFKIVYEK